MLRCHHHLPRCRPPQPPRSPVLPDATPTFPATIPAHPGLQSPLLPQSPTLPQCHLIYPRTQCCGVTLAVPPALVPSITPMPPPGRQHCPAHPKQHLHATSPQLWSLCTCPKASHPSVVSLHLPWSPPLHHPDVPFISLAIPSIPCCPSVLLLSPASPSVPPSPAVPSIPSCPLYPPAVPPSLTIPPSLAVPPSNTFPSSPAVPPPPAIPSIRLLHHHLLSGDHHHYPSFTCCLLHHLPNPCPPTVPPRDHPCTPHARRASPCTWSPSVPSEHPYALSPPAAPQPPIPSPRPLLTFWSFPSKAPLTPAEGARARGGAGAVPGRCRGAVPVPPPEHRTLCGGGRGGATMAETAVPCRVQYLEDSDPFGCGSFPEPRRAPVYAVEEALALGAQLPAVHRLLGAPLPVNKGDGRWGGRAEHPERGCGAGVPWGCAIAAWG